MSEVLRSECRQRARKQAEGWRNKSLVQPVRHTGSAQHQETSRRQEVIRRTPIKRSTTPIPRRRKRPRRVSVLRDQAYMDWLKKQKCVVCKILKMCYRDRRCASGSGPIDPAHTVSNGRSSKGPDSSCIPLCRHHHDEMDGRLSTAITTKEQFAAKYGLDLANEARAHFFAFKLLTLEECSE